MTFNDAVALSLSLFLSFFHCTCVNFLIAMQKVFVVIHKLTFNKSLYQEVEEEGKGKGNCCYVLLLEVQCCHLITSYWRRGYAAYGAAFSQFNTKNKNKQTKQITYCQRNVKLKLFIVCM